MYPLCPAVPGWVDCRGHPATRAVFYHYHYPRMGGLYGRLCGAVKTEDTRFQCCDTGNAYNLSDEQKGRKEETYQFCLLLGVSVKACPVCCPYYDIGVPNGLLIAG